MIDEQYAAFHKICGLDDYYEMSARIRELEEKLAAAIKYTCQQCVETCDEFDGIYPCGSGGNNTEGCPLWWMNSAEAEAALERRQRK